ncbi:MAG: carboxypeptidase-like regulatory domain-containing protein [Chitinophagaceae bacterium]
MKKVFRYTTTQIFAHLLCLSFIVAQKGIINGTVRGVEGALSAATVSAGQATVLTDVSGRFALSLDSGYHTLIVTQAGYKKATQGVALAPGKFQTVAITLTPDEELGEVVVLGSRSMVQRSNLNTPVPVDVFASSRLLQTGQISLTQMLNAAAPSFNASRELSNEAVTLPGPDPQHILILLNGCTLP